MKVLYNIVALLLLASCGGNSGPSPEPPTPDPGPKPDIVTPPTPDPTSHNLYNGIVTPTVWPPMSSSSSNIYSGMSPFYLANKPSVINITIGRQLFVDDFLIAETNLNRTWHQAEYYSGNPVLKPEAEWEMNVAGGGSAAPFSDGVWFDEIDGKFKMWYMAGGGNIASGNPVTCYAESTDGIHWTRPSLNVKAGTNIVFVSSKLRDSNTIWIDKTESNASYRYKMFQVYGGAGNWAYHYCTSSDGKAWREQNASLSIADRSTAFYNPFRGVWVWSMRHNVRVDASTLVRARDYYENSNVLAGNKAAKADLQNFWFGPWPQEPHHPIYNSQQPAIYNLDAIAYESVMLGSFSVWSGPENDVCASEQVVKRNQLLLGYSRDGWSWHREDFTPFCSVGTKSSDWNNGNIQSAAGSPIIVGDKLYFYVSGRHLNSENKEIISTGLATLRRDGFASMDGSGHLTTEKFVFTGQYFYVNSNGTIKVELLNADGSVLPGFSKEECNAVTGDKTKSLVTWKNNPSIESLKGKTIRAKFYLENANLYSFWVSQFSDGRSYGYTGGGGKGLNKNGLDM